jgi:hypothetical protein
MNASQTSRDLVVAGHVPVIHDSDGESLLRAVGANKRGRKDDDRKFASCTSIKWLEGEEKKGVEGGGARRGATDENPAIELRFSNRVEGELRGSREELW